MTRTAGPSTFKAHVTDKATGERFDFDASTVAQYDQVALFKDYTAKAKALGFKTGVISHAKNPAGGNWGSAPKFTAPAFTKDERHWLGREVGFRPEHCATFVPVADGTRPPYNGREAVAHGTVWSLAPAPRSVWVYVTGSGFFIVKMDALLMGVNA